MRTHPFDFAQGRLRHKNNFFLEKLPRMGHPNGCWIGHTNQLFKQEQRVGNRFAVMASWRVSGIVERGRFFLAGE
jgi:hypothetical protein